MASSKLINDLSSMDRRRWLQWLAAAGAGLVVASGAQAQTSSPDVEQSDDKFYDDGQVRRFAGNTIICHLPQQGEHSQCFNALMDIYRTLPKYDFMRKAAILPTSSYHMTICSGANDKDRRYPVWPTDLPLDMSMAECDRELAKRLANFKLEMPLPIRMKVDLSEPDPNEFPLRIRLLPADGAENSKLRILRQRLGEVMHIHRPDDDDYRFHMSMAYVLSPLTAAENAAFRQTLMMWQREVAKASPMIEFGAPEYCTFDDMYVFHRQLFLS